MGLHRAFQGVRGSQEPGCDKCGVNDTDIDKQVIKKHFNEMSSYVGVTMV